MKKGEIVTVETKGKWKSKEEQVFEKGINLVAKSKVKAEDDVVECWVFDIK